MTKGPRPRVPGNFSDLYRERTEKKKGGIIFRPQKDGKMGLTIFGFAFNRRTSCGPAVGFRVRACDVVADVGLCRVYF